MPGKIPALELEHWRVIVNGIDRVLKTTLEEAHLAPELWAVVDRARSCLGMAREILESAAAYARGLPVREALMLLHDRDILWRMLSDSVPVGLAVASKGDHSLRLNSMGRRIMGFQDDSEIRRYVFGAMPQFELFHLDGTPFKQDERPVERFMAGQPLTGEVCRFVNGAGRSVVALVSGGAADPSDPDSPVLLMALDVTEIIHLRVQAQAAEEGLLRSLRVLEQKSAEWEALFESLDEVIFLLERGAGSHWNLVSANSAALDMFGASNVEELQAMHPSLALKDVAFVRTNGEPVPPQETPALLIHQGLPFSDYTAVIRGRDGQDVEILISGGPVRDIPGMRQRYIETFRVVTELRRLERAREQLLQVVSHELRNPLQVIKGLLGVMRLPPEPPHGEAMMKYLNILDHQIDHLSAFMNDVMRAYRETSKPEMDLEPVDIVDALRDAVEPYILHGDGHEIVMEAGADAHLLVNGDRRRLEEIVQNLLSNAIKYSPAAPRVRITVQPGVADLVVRVEDEGIGIPPDELEKVFEGFYRPKDLSSWHTNGVGLGLFISRSIARRHGGDLWAENRPGGGTAMCLRLPLFRSS